MTATRESIVTMPLSEAKESYRPYQPYGAAAALMECRDPEVLLDGPVRTGKSLGDLNKLFLCAEKYPRMRGAIIRKTRKSLTQTTLVTWEEEVVDAGNACLRGPQREQRSTYRFPNGSEVIVAGLDDPQKVFGGQFDMIVIPEAIELDEDDLDKVSTRMSNGVMPYSQIVMDCNPDVPMHWLLKRCAKGQTTRFSSHHEDNPKHWDREMGEWTPAGVAYMSRLDNLQGFLKQRLRDGLWVAAEGAVYDCFDTENDVIPPREIPAEWPRYLGLDFGAVHTAAVFFAADPDNDDLYLYREYLEGGRTAAQHAFWLRLNEPERLTVVGGSASEEQWRREFALAGLPVLEPRITDVALGISRVYGQHKRHAIKVFKTCTGYLEQKADYRYKRDAAVPGEIENKHMYHFCFVADTKIETSCGPVRIDRLKRGDLILTRDGYKRIGTCLERENQPLRTVTFSNLRTLTGTPDHPLWVIGKGWVSIDALRYGDTMLRKEDCYPCKQKRAPSTASPTTVTLTRPDNPTAAISSGTVNTFIGPSGSSITGPFLTGVTSTTATKTPRTTTLPIWKRLLSAITSRRTTLTSPLTRSPSSSASSSPPRCSGISPKRAARGIASTPKTSTQSWRPVSVPVSIAANAISFVGTVSVTASAHPSAGPPLGMRAASMMRSARARFAALLSRRTNTVERASAPVHVLSVHDEGRTGTVYNLTVQDVHEYFANGVLVSNCDAERYIVGWLRPERDTWVPGRPGRKGLAKARER